MHIEDNRYTFCVLVNNVDGLDYIFEGVERGKNHSISMF